MDTLAPNTTKLRLGLGFIVTSRLDASAAKLYPVVPYVNFTYKEWFTLDENEARANFFTSKSEIGAAGWRAGPMLKVDLGRGRFKNSNLRSLPKVDPSLELGGFVSYSFGPARLRLRVRDDVTRSEGGVIAELDARVGLYKSERLSFGVDAETVSLSSAYMRTFYGITPQESVSTGLSAFNPGSGMRSVGLSLFGEYKFSSRWSVIAATQYIRSIGPAAASPLTIRRGGTNRATLGTFLVYTF